MILDPIIPEQGLVMLYAPRGVGKTHVSLSIASAVAFGTCLFDNKWQCTKPRRVLFVDGEMPASVLKERLANIVPSIPEYMVHNGNLIIINPDLTEHGIPDLSTASGQQQVEEHLEGVSLLILDNLSALCRSGKENESESWTPLQEWLLKLRRQGISVLFLHHANKNGKQRGTSKKEDLLDTIVTLSRPENYHAKDGARFEVHYEKSRSFYGDQAKPFEAWLKKDQGKTFWEIKELEDSRLQKILELHKEGLTQREIAKDLAIGIGTVNRALKRAENK
jgi:putative DNA primase/helicase